MGKRTFAEIAQEIKSVWGAKINAYAQPYLQALLEINSTDKHAMYYYDSAQSVVMYFLANANTFRGDDARRLKNELKDMLK